MPHRRTDPVGFVLPLAQVLLPEQLRQNRDQDRKVTVVPGVTGRKDREVARRVIVLPIKGKVGPVLPVVDWAARLPYTLRNKSRFVLPSSR